MRLIDFLSSDLGVALRVDVGSILGSCCCCGFFVLLALFYLFRNRGFEEIYSYVAAFFLALLLGWIQYDEDMLPIWAVALVVISPVFAVILFQLIWPKGNDLLFVDKEKKCVWCLKKIPKAAHVCSYCGRAGQDFSHKKKTHWWELDMDNAEAEARHASEAERARAEARKAMTWTEAIKGAARYVGLSALLIIVVILLAWLSCK